MVGIANVESMLSDVSAMRLSKVEWHWQCDTGPRLFSAALFGAKILCFLLTLTQTLNKWTVKEHRIGAETICAENVRQRNRWCRNGRTEKTWSHVILIENPLSGLLVTLLSDFDHSVWEEGLDVVMYKPFAFFLEPLQPLWSCTRSRSSHSHTVHAFIRVRARFRE